MNFKISVITINYNDKIGIENTIKSTVNQIFKNFEFIIIDGGSNDGSVDIIKSNSDKIDYWISEPDNGVYNAMNKGIKVAKGEYLIFMNSGDSFYNSYTLEKIVMFLDGKYNIVYGNSAFVRNNIFVKFSYPPSKLSFIHFFNSGLNHQATFIKKELFEKYFYYNESYKIASDWEFFMYAICMMQEPYLYVNQTICNYDLTGISSDFSEKSLYAKERNEILNKHVSFLKDDFDKFKDLGDKRVKNILYIKKHKIAWKILKSFSKIILFFLPKRQN